MADAIDFDNSLQNMSGSGRVPIARKVSYHVVIVNRKNKIWITRDGHNTESITLSLDDVDNRQSSSFAIVITPKTIDKSCIRPRFICHGCRRDMIPAIVILTRLERYQHAERGADQSAKVITVDS